MWMCDQKNILTQDSSIYINPRDKLVSMESKRSFHRMVFQSSLETRMSLVPYSRQPLDNLKPFWWPFWILSSYVWIDFHVIGWKLKFRNKGKWMEFSSRLNLLSIFVLEEDALLVFMRAARVWLGCFSESCFYFFIISTCACDDRWWDVSPDIQAFDDCFCLQMIPLSLDTLHVSWHEHLEPW